MESRSRAQEVSSPTSQPTTAAMAAKSDGRGLRFWLAFWSLGISNLAVAFESTTLSVALPAISIDLGGGSLEAFWSGISYLLASVVVVLPCVSLSDGFGRRSVVLAALVIFLAGSIICALAQDYAVLIAGRTIMGLGGGSLLGLNVVVITDMVPLRDRGKFWAINSIVYAMGTISGPIIGGALATAGQWRWIFWINLPICAISLVGIAIFLRLHQQKRSIQEKLREFDYIGMGLFMASLTAFVIPITWGGTEFAWNSWRTLFPLCLGAAGLVICFVYEGRISKTPFIPMEIFSSYTVCILYLGSFVHGLILFCFTYFMPEYFQAVKQYTPLIAGVAALPQTATVVPSAGLVGLMVDKTGRYRWIQWMGWALTIFGCGLKYLLDVETTVVQWVFLTCVSGIGLGILFPSIGLALQSSVPQTHVAMSATLVMFFRTLGQTIGVAVGQTILSDRMKTEEAKAYLAPLMPGGFEDVNVASLADYIAALPAASPLAAALKRALVASFRVVWIVMCALAGATMLIHFAIKEYDMNQEHVTNQQFIDDDDDKPSSDAMRRTGDGAAVELFTS